MIGWLFWKIVFERAPLCIALEPSSYYFCVTVSLATRAAAVAAAPFVWIYSVIKTITTTTVTTITDTVSVPHFYLAGQCDVARVFYK